jgi:hypothetical protein
VHSDIGLRLDALYRASVGQPLDLRAGMQHGREPVIGVKFAATVARPRRSVDDLLHAYADQLRRISLADDVKDGAPDRTRRSLAKLVLLRDRLRAETGDDILAPLVTRLNMSTPADRFPSDVPMLLSRPRDVVLAQGGATGIGGSAPTIAAEKAPALAAATGGVLDMRDVRRPRQHGVAVGRFTATKVPGTYTIAVTASGLQHVLPLPLRAARPGQPRSRGGALTRRRCRRSNATAARHATP